MNQVTNRSVYVVNTGHAVTPHILAEENKIYFEYNGVGNETITTDKIDFGKIKHIRISNPTGEKFKEWHITAPLFDANEEPNLEYLVHLNFEHADGFDRMESKVASLVATSKMLNSSTTSYTKTFDGVLNANGTAANNVTVDNKSKAFVYEMAARIAAQFIKGMNPFEISVANDAVLLTATADGTATTFNFSSESTIVYVDGVKQTSGYSLSGTTLTFDNAPTSGKAIKAIYNGEEVLSATGDGTTTAFTMSDGDTFTVTDNGTPVTSGISITGAGITFTTAPTIGHVIEVSATGNNHYHVVLKENALYPTITRLERRIYPFSQKMFITTNRVKGETESWCADVAAASVQQPSKRFGRYYGEATPWKSLKNGYLVWLMERNTFLDHNEMIYPDLCDGYVAGDMITDSTDMETSTANSGAQYYMVDIAYWTQPNDVVAKSNLKELTFCVKDETVASPAYTGIGAAQAIAHTVGLWTGSSAEPSTLATDGVIVYQPKVNAGQSAQ